jgi:uncharacterized glyoxalase superfamily protein PhnB
MCTRRLAGLLKGFGFTRHAVYDGPDNTVAHAQLTLGGGMFMPGSESNGGGFADRMTTLAETGGRETIGLCVVVTDCEATFCARACCRGGDCSADAVARVRWARVRVQRPRRPYLVGWELQSVGRSIKSGGDRSKFPAAMTNGMISTKESGITTVAVTFCRFRCLQRLRLGCRRQGRLRWRSRVCLVRRG